MEKNILDTYFNSYFKDVNDLSIKGFDKSVKFYSWIYRDFLPKDKNFQILDLGCGTGHFLYFLEKEGYKNYYGVDDSEDQIKFCKEKITKKVELSDAFKFLELKKEKFDLIITNDFLEHIQKQRLFKLLSLIKSSLKAEGILLVSVPNMSNPFSLMNRYKDITHEIGFTESSLTEALKMSGFKDIKIRGASYPVVSFKTAVGKVATIFVYNTLKLLFRVQGHSAPKFLDKSIVALASK